MTGENAWLSRFRPLMNRDEIRRRAAVTPARLSGLKRLSIEGAQDAINTALKELFVVTEQSLDILQMHVNRAFAFCVRVYPSEQAYVERLFTPNWLPHYERAILLTGLAGSGKTQLARAVPRVLPSDDEVFVGGPLQCKMPLEASAYVSFQSQETPRTALEKWLPIDTQGRVAASEKVAAPKPPKLGDSRVIELAGFEFYKRGIVSAIGDEYQFVTQSEGANAKLVRMLLALIYLGVPATNILNFSACHKLERRPQEERDRILARIIHVAPDAPDSADWKLLMAAYDRVLEEILGFRVVDRSEEVWQLTAASKRTIRRLFALGYRLTREAGRTRIELRDLERAFRTLEFAALRSDVEATIEMLARGAPINGRKDLWCPFGGNDWYRPAPETAPEQAIEAKIAAAYMEESLSPEQRRELAQLRQAEADSVPRQRVRSVVRGKQATNSATLLRNSQIHRASVKR